MAEKKAVNWTASMAVKEIRKGNLEAINNIARRYPIAFYFLAKNGEGAWEILEKFPDWLTMRKLEGILKNAEQDEAEDTDDSDEEEVEAKKPAKKAEPEDDEDEDDEFDDEDEDEPAPKKKGKKYYLHPN